MKKRVLQVNINNTGGAFSIVYQVGETLTDKYIFDYYTPDYFIKNDIYQHLVNNGSLLIESHIDGNRALKQIKQSFVFYKFLKRTEYNVIHIHSDTAWKMCIYSIPAHFIGGIKVITHSHSTGINGHYRWFNDFLHKLSRSILMKTSHYPCACSSLSAKWMYGKKADNAKVIRNGVNISNFLFNQEARNTIRYQYNIGDNQILIGTVGDFSWAKNIEFLINVFEKLVTDDRYILICIGDGKGRKNIENIVRSKGLIEKVIFTGTVVNIGEMLNAIDIFAFPSIFEGLPVSVLEAQVNGIVSLLSSNIDPEIICSDKCIFADLNDINLWINLIRNIDFNYDRTDYREYLDESKVDIVKTSQHFTELYSM